MKRDRDEKRYWLDDPRHVDLVFYAVVAICAAWLVPDLFVQKHVFFGWDGLFGFFGGYGFVGCVFLVLTAKQLRRVLMRDEDYYDRDPR